MLGQKFVKFFRWYFGKFNTPKFHSEITWPLNFNSLVHTYLVFKNCIDFDFFFVCLDLIYLNLFPRISNPSPQYYWYPHWIYHDHCAHSLLLHTYLLFEDCVNFCLLFKIYLKFYLQITNFPTQRKSIFGTPKQLKHNPCAHSSVNTYLFFWLLHCLSWLELCILKFCSNFKFLYIIHIFGTPTRVNHYHCAMCNEHYETEIVLNSNLMIPDFPHNIRIRLSWLIFFFDASWRCSVSALLAVSV